MSKNKVLRFGFGTEDSPGSSIWRASFSKNKGDVYLTFIPFLGDKVHVALHPSGQFHVKIKNGQNHKLDPPHLHTNGHYYGPVLFYYDWVRPYKPPQPSGSVNLIKWLGTPQTNHFLTVQFLYCNPNSKIELESNQYPMFEAVPVKLFNKAMYFVMLVTERHMSPIEIESTRKAIETLDFKGTLKKDSQIELIRFTKAQPWGSAIVIERYLVK